MRARGECQSVEGKDRTRERAAWVSEWVGSASDRLQTQSRRVKVQDYNGDVCHTIQIDTDGQGEGRKPQADNIREIESESEKAIGSPVSGARARGGREGRRKGIRVWWVV